MIVYIAAARARVKHLTHLVYLPPGSRVQEGIWVPLCKQERRPDWRLIVADNDPRRKAPLCSRCLDALDKLNEAATNG